MATKLLDGGHRPPGASRRITKGTRRPVRDGLRLSADAGGVPHGQFGDDGLISGKAIKLLVNTCTVGVPFVKEVEQAAAARGITVVDCPISGGPPGARSGTLSVMVSGEPSAVDRLRPMISLWGRTVTVAGDKPGAAQVLKLTNNILSAVALAATAEAFWTCPGFVEG
jgi:3-hydroxyisobutyrate dehydrogenase-like beta-hydroxyacid dehydrogenase